MTPWHRSAWPLLLSLLACQPAGEQDRDDSATLSSRLEATEQRLAAIETKLTR